MTQSISQRIDVASSTLAMIGLLAPLVLAAIMTVAAIH